MNATIEVLPGVIPFTDNNLRTYKTLTDVQKSYGQLFTDVTLNYGRHIEFTNPTRDVGQVFLSKVTCTTPSTHGSLNDSFPLYNVNTEGVTGGMEKSFCTKYRVISL